MSATAFARWAFPLGLAIEARGNTWTTWEVEPCLSGCPCGHEHATADEATACPWDPERPVVCDLLVRQVRAGVIAWLNRPGQLAMPWGGHRLRQRAESRRAA